MRKIVLALALVGICATAASADLELWYDVRGSLTDIDTAQPPYTNSASLSPYITYGIGQNYPLQNGGSRGDGERVYVSPKLPDYTNPYTFLPGDPDTIPEHQWPFDTSIDYSLASINLWASFNGNDGEVVSSIGVDQDLDAGSLINNGTNFYLANATTTTENVGLWDGYLPNPSNATAATTIKLVQVPVIAGPAFDATAGIGNSDTEIIGSLALEGSDRNGTSAVGVYNVFLSVNNLLVTRVAELGAADMNVAFGYDSGSPEVWGSGTSLIGTNATADAVVTVVRKGDFDYDGFAATGIDDFAYYGINLNFNGSNCNPAEMWLSDFDADLQAATGIDDYGYYQASVVP